MAGIASGDANSWEYHVFLSFRGEDVRKGFVDHLYYALKTAGIRVFRDNEGLDLGSDIQAKLYRAIERSQLSVVILSSRYPTSRWCLDELVKIVECKKLHKHMVVPIFYDIEPTVVRHQSGLYKLAFQEHEQKYQGELPRVENWRKALKLVADLKGLCLLQEADGHEALFIQKIIAKVRRIVGTHKLSVPPRVFGINTTIERLQEWLLDGSPDVGIGVVYGIGGIGKTTIAKIVYNNSHLEFDASSFLADIKRNTRQANDFVRLQRQLVSDITRNEANEIYNVHEGMMKISEVIGYQRILLVLDHVDDLEDLCGLFDHPEWFCRGSKILVTTRRREWGNVDMLSEEFQVSELTDYDSIRMFSQLAFGRDSPLQDYAEHTGKFISYCQGLPLALEVLASSLSRKTVDIWESQLAKLDTFPVKKIQEVLKLSLDDLGDDDDRQIFLHIALFFVGMELDHAIRVLDNCRLHAKIGVQNLIQRCLVTVDGNRLMMHGLIQEMGRDVVQQESPHEPGKRSRLWRHEDTCDVLRKKKGTSAIRGLHFNRFSSKCSCATCIIPASQPSDTLSAKFIETDSFTKMTDLNILLLNYVQIQGSFSNFPKAIKWLRWHGCPLELIPMDFDLLEVVVLDMRHSSLVRAWEGDKALRALQILNLSHSHSLIDTPDLSNAPNLERIILEDCISLVQIHESIENLTKLTFLNLTGCKNLRNLPNGIKESHFLQKLILVGSSFLYKVMSKMKSSFIRMHDLVSRPINNAKDLESSLVSQRDRIPRSSYFCFHFSPSLKGLFLVNCGILHDTVFDDLSCLPLLKELHLTGNPISVINKDLSHFSRLMTLDLRNCTNLVSISTLPQSCEVVADGCSSLERMIFLPMSTWALEVRVRDCPKLADIVRGHNVKLEAISDLDAEMARYLGFPGLETLGNYPHPVQPNTFVKGLYEWGLFSVFLPGKHSARWFPELFEHEIWFSVPFMPFTHRIRAFNICVAYENGGERGIGTGLLKLRNVSRDLKWTYRPTDTPKYVKGSDFTWLTHWCMRDHLMAVAGDVMKISLEDSFSLDNCATYEVKLGIRILIEELEVESSRRWSKYILKRPIVPTIEKVLKEDIRHSPNLEEFRINFLNKELEVESSNGSSLRSKTTEELLILQQALKARTLRTSKESLFHPTIEVMEANNEAVSVRYQNALPENLDLSEFESWWNPGWLNLVDNICYY